MASQQSNVGDRSRFSPAFLRLTGSHRHELHIKRTPNKEERGGGSREGEPGNCLLGLHPSPRSTRVHGLTRPFSLILHPLVPYSRWENNSQFTRLFLSFLFASCFPDDGFEAEGWSDQQQDWSWLGAGKMIMMILVQGKNAHRTAGDPRFALAAGSGRTI